MNSDNVVAMIIMVVLFISVASIFILRGPLGRAWAKRIEGARGDDETTHRLEDVESRLQTLELTQERMLELEERLDFAERLLAREKDIPRIGRTGAES